MLLRRITQHFNEQNWTAIGIDLVIVVVGVFIGIQVANWNEERESQIAERAFIGSIRDDISQNIKNGEGFIDMLSGVRDHGRNSLESINSEASCSDDCWAKLVDFFLATQWIDVRINYAMFEEIKRTGLPRDLKLKATLARYYGSTEQVTIIAEQLPRYRELVRSTIPADVQIRMWTDCIGIYGRQQIMIPDCPAPISEAEARAVVDMLRANNEIESSLTYWISTVSVIMIGLTEQHEVGQEVIDELEQYLAVRN